MRDEDLREEFDHWLRRVRGAEPPGMPLIRRRLRRRRSRNAVAGVAALGAAAGIVVAVQPGAAGPHPTAGPRPTASPWRTPVPATSGIPVSSTRPSPIRGGYQRSASYTVSSPVSTLNVSGSVGNVTVTGSQRSTVSVTEQMQYSRKPPTMTRHLTGRTLTLAYTCPNESLCAASYDIQVPRGITVTAASGNGQVRLSSLGGPVTASSGLGDITATGLTSHTADFSAGNGAIDAVFAAVPDMVHAAAGLGSITIHVPGTASYHVNLQTTMGTASVTVPQSASSTHSISASTPMGSTTIAPEK